MITYILSILHSWNLSSQLASFIIIFAAFWELSGASDRCTTPCDERVNCFGMEDIRIADMMVQKK